MGAFTTGEGFAAIVPMHAPAMLRVATALIGPADAEDAVREAAMRAWQAWATLRNPDAAQPRRCAAQQTVQESSAIPCKGDHLMPVDTNRPPYDDPSFIDWIPE